MAARKHAAKLTRLHVTRIILGLGTSVKSAPLIPFDKEMDPNANTRKTDSNNATSMAFNDGWKANDAMVPVIARTKTEKKTMKKYLLFTRLLAEIGEE